MPHPPHPTGRRALVLLGALAVACAPVEERGEATALRPDPPALHHVHLNTTDAEAALAWYQALWSAGRTGEVAGHDAFLAETAILFTEVDEAPPGAWDPALQRAEPQSPFWHFGAFVNTTGLLAALADRGFEVLPLWTGPSDREGVARSGLAPYAGIRTAAALDTATEVGPRPGGFGYLAGPDGALVELTGRPGTTPSFSHVHLYHEEPACAARWYVEHLGMALPTRRDPATGDTLPGVLPEPCAGAERGRPGWPSLEHAGTIRSPNARVRYAGGSLSIYPRQCVGGRCGEDRPLVGSRGQVLDHVAFAVDDLGARVARLRAEGVTFLEEPYPFGAGRAVLVEGPDGLAIELVEAP